MIVRKLHVETNQPNNEPMIKVAFATNDRRHVNQHFGQAKSFIVYALNETQYQLIDAIDFSEKSRGHSQLAERTSVLVDCDAVYFNQCGTAALKQLLVLKTVPVKVEEGEPIQSCLMDLMRDMKEKREGWLNKRISMRNSDQENQQEYLDSLLDEPWNSME
ncbi:NifB/NifX family molybdenum-iron cluster-binding protein [Vibrio agarivorans]|uniref:NifB/NifX family molybdenum-iron cluster-binding protein n=1 Tax=Vibrio agarivorans TaxID=153622 RepID=A0ABT7XZN0_9VIBR|nr:NifB/NifX family molybdenum-iron cluster-binding protein [Vibrio agarivorans]MDN2481243.1 NifB/NifX family molybdenum-iron cluster-binding protein [Vibrio agarivorans]